MAELSSEPLYYERGIPCVFVSLQFKAKIVVLPSHNALENEDGDNYHSSRREREKEEDEEEEGEKKKTKQGQQRQEEEVNEREEGEEIEYKKKKNRKEIRPRRKRSCRVRLSEVEGVLDDLSSTASGYFVCKLHKLLKRCGEVNEDNEEKKKKIGEEEEEEEREEQSPSSFFDRYTCKVFGSLDEVSDFLCHIGELYLVIIPMKEYSTKMNTYRRQKKDEGKNLVHVSSSPPPSSNTIRTSPSIRLRTPVCMLDSREDLSSGDASRQPRKTDRRVSFSSLPPLSQSPSSFSSSSSHGEDEEAEKKDVKPPLDLPRNMSPSQQNLVNPSGSFEEEEEEVEEEERYVTFSLKEIFENGSLSVPASSSLHRQHPFSSSSSLYFYNEVQLDPGDDGTLLWASLYLQEYLVPYGFHRSHPSLPSLDTGYPFLLSLSVIQNRSVRTLLQGGGAEGGGGGGKEGGVALHQDERDSNRHDADEKKRKPQEGSSYSHLTQNAGSLLLSLRLNSSKRLCHLTSSSSFLSNEKLSSSSSSSSSGDSSSSSLFSPCTFTLPLVGNWQEALIYLKYLAHASAILEARKDSRTAGGGRGGGGEQDSLNTTKRNDLQKSLRSSHIRPVELTIDLTPVSTRITQHLAMLYHSDAFPQGAGSTSSPSLTSTNCLSSLLYSSNHPSMPRRISLQGQVLFLAIQDSFSPFLSLKNAEEEEGNDLDERSRKGKDTPMFLSEHMRDQHKQKIWRGDEEEEQGREKKKNEEEDEEEEEEKTSVLREQGLHSIPHGYVQTSEEERIIQSGKNEGEEQEEEREEHRIHSSSLHQISQQEKKGQIFHSSSENINPQVQEKHSFHNGEETENLLLLQSSSFLPSPHPSSSCSVFLQQNNVSACSQEKRDLRPKTSSNFSSHGMYKETDEKEKKPPPSPSLISQSGLSHPSFIPQMSSSSSESNQDREMECIYTSKTSERKGERNDEHVKETFFPPSFSVQERNHYEVVSSSSQEMKYWRLSIDLLSIQFFAMNANHPNAPSSHARRQVYIQYNYPPFGASHLFSTQPPVDCSKQDDQQVPLTNGFCAYTLTASSQRLRHSLQSFPLTLHICSSSTSSPPSSSSVPPPRNRAFATSPGTSAQTSHSSSCSSSPHYRSSSSFSERKNGSSGEVTSASKRGISTVSDRSRGRPSSGVGRQKGEEKEEDEEKGSSVLLGVCTLDLSVVLQQPLLRNYQAPFQYQAYSSLLPIIQAQNSKIPASEKHHNIGQVSIQVFLEHLLLLPSAPDATGEKKVLSSSSSFPSAVDSGTQSIGVSVHPSSIQSIQQEPRPHSHHLLHSISPSPPLPSSSSFSSCGRRANEAFLLEESFKTAYELELWKRSEEVKFLAELQKRMTEEREKMLEEVKVKEDKQNQEIREKQEAIHLLQSQLKQTAQNLQQKALELQGRENELRVEKERCLEISAQTAEELAVVTRRMKEEKDHAIELEKQKSLHLQRQNEDLEEEVKRIRLRVELLEEENYDLRCQITSAPTAQLQADLKLKMYQVANLESQLSAMTASRDHFVSNCAALLEKLHAIRDQMRERSTAYIQRREEDEEETQRERKRSLRSRSHSSGLNASRKDMSCSSSPSDMIEKSSEERMKNEIDALRSDILSLKEIFMNERRLSSSSLPNQEKKEEKGKEDKISLSLHENMNSSSSSSSFHRLPLSLPVPSSSSVSTLALQHLSYPSSPPPKNLFGFTNQHVFSSSSSALPSERKKVIGEDGRKEEQERERREDNEKADHLQTRERESFLSSNEEKEKNEDKTSLLSLTPVERSLPPTPHPQNLLGVHARKEEEEKIKKSKRKDQEDDDGDREEVEIKVKMIERQLDTLLRQGIYREEDGVIRALRSRIKDLRQMNDMLLQKEHKESEK